MKKIVAGKSTPVWRETERLAALRSFEILDTEPEASFDDIAAIVAEICQAPIAVINFVDEGRQWFKSEIGLGIRETPLDVSICAHAILQPNLFVIPDTTTDPRFNCNPLVRGEPFLRFYAGALLETSEGLPLGTLCVLDYEPRPEGLTEKQSETLLALARAVMNQLKLRQASKVIAESERKFRTIAEAMPQMAWSTRPDGQPDYSNRHWYEYTGLPFGSADKGAWDRLLHPDDRDRAQARWQRSLVTGEPYEMEYRLRHHSGEYRWILGRALPVRNEKGEIEGWFGTNTDVHDWKRTDQALAESEHRYRALVEASATLVWRATPDGSIIDASSGWKDVSGQEPGDFRGYGWLDTVHPDDRERVIRHWQNVLASRQPGGDEFRVRHVNGEYRWFATKAVPLLNAEGIAQEWVGTITDVHEQKVAAERIHRSEERYRALINANAAVVWRANPEGSILEGWGWETFCGQTPEAFTGYGWLDNVHPDDRERVTSVWQEALASRQPITGEYRVRHLDGEHRWVFTRAVPILGAGGAVQEWVGTITDIHEQKVAAARIQESEERSRALLEASAMVLWFASPDGMIQSSRGWIELTGQAEGEYNEIGWLDSVHPEDRPHATSAWQTALLKAGFYTAEFRVRHASGEYRWVAASAVPRLNQDGSVHEWVGSLSDIQGRKRAEDQLRTSEERLRLALHAGRMVAWEYDPATDYITRSSNALELLGIGSGPLSEFLERGHPEDRQVREGFTDALKTKGAGSMESRFILPSGKTLWLASRGEKADSNRIVGISFDITDRKEAEHQVWLSANHDPLTGLPNRALFQQRLDQALAEAKRDSTCVSLLMIDLDHFKDINDTLGHDAGDALLKKTAARLSAMTRDCDTVARLGGDEFAIMLVEPLSLEHAARYAEAVTKKLRKPFSHARRSITTGASIGLAAFPDHDRDLSELIKDADIALYQAKAKGRSRVVTYSPDMRQEIVERVVLARDVRKAVSRQEITPFYQPKVCLSSGRIIGFEALARWQHPKKGILTPAYFGSAFDDPELAVAIGKQMMIHVISTMREWLDSGLSFGRVALNLSSAEFDQEGLADRILGTLDDMQVPPQQFEVEVTETVLVGRSSDDVAATLKQLCEKGVRVALDDFGTGYASLTHLKQFPVDHIKIDQSFVRAIEHDKDDESIVAAIIGLSRSLKLEVTAEGVETKGQAQRLQAIGCQNAQGFLYGKPVAGSQVPILLLDWADRLILPMKLSSQG